MNVKKIFAILMLLTLAFSIVGCTKSKTEDSLQKELQQMKDTHDKQEKNLEK